MERILEKTGKEKVFFSHVGQGRGEYARGSSNAGNKQTRRKQFQRLAYFSIWVSNWEKN